MRLRPFQQQALQILSRPAHLICVAPTGSGKSLIYEKVAAEPGRKTLLITPLVALARQQAATLRSQGVPVRLGAGSPADPPPESRSWSGAWIVSPERLFHESSRARAALDRWGPDFLAVDECHCLWDWGEDFRPAFREVPELIRSHRIARSVWLTATLPPGGAALIQSTLPEPPARIGRFDLPPGLRLRVLQVPRVRRVSALVEQARRLGRGGIVFVQTRESTLRLQRLLNAAGLRASAYHAGLSSEERRAIEKSIGLQIPDVIVATSAFGMGMDHPHLRWVILWQPPSSLLALAQSIGRVGRAGRQGEALIFWDQEDFKLLDWTVRGSVRRRKALEAVWTFLWRPRCRLAGLISYFEEEPLDPASRCGRCDTCAQGPDTGSSTSGGLSGSTSAAKIRVNV